MAAIFAEIDFLGATLFALAVALANLLFALASLALIADFCSGSAFFSAFLRATTFLAALS